LPSAETITNTFVLTPTQDFGYLREKGLQYIQQLSGKMWTDHNLHDPGITILEVLCYALMDLGYRTNFSMNDLVTEPDGSIDRVNAFHPAHKIFTTHPVTVDDYRKILVDIPGIRNAWLFTKDEIGKTFDEGIKLFAYCKNSELLHESEIDAKIPELADRQHVRQNEELRIKGLYAVKIEPDEHPIFGDLSSSTVSVKIVKGELATSGMEIVFPHWSAKDKNNNEIVSMLKAAKIDQLAVELINDTTLKKKDFEALKRSQWKTRWMIKYGAQERVLENVMVRMVQMPESFNGLVKGDALQKAFQTPVATEALKRYRQRPREIFKIFSIVREKLMQHRNLCEDFLHSIDTVDTEELSICADMDIEVNVDLETIQATVFDKVENYLLPPVQFSTLKELLDANVPVEEIFNGPVLDHGFLTNEAMKNADLKREYYISDIISLLMDIPGVLNVRNFKFSVAKNGISQPSLHDWKVTVTPNHKLKLKREKCKLLYFKNNLPLNASFRESVNKLGLQQSLQAHLKFKDPSKEIELPQGKYRNLEKHYTILNEFPRVYGLGEKDLPEDVSIERKARVKQLEAYLTFFDQLLADYCSQLQHLKDILSWKENPAQTYFTQYFYTKNDAEQLFWQKDFLGSKLSTDFLATRSEVEKNYLKDKTGLQYLKESTATYLDRRNRMLDHLTARFSESFNDYALYMYGLPDERVMDDETVSHDLIKSKLKFLKNYEILSKERSKAFDYSIEEDEVLQTSNLSGYSRRMRALLGMAFDKTGQLHNLPDNDMGGFHLLEHLMLRPSKEGDALLGVCLDPQCDHCGEEDPYSFRVSIVLPFWLKRFKNIAFRNFMETLFRAEAPAHILLKICWVDKTEMKKFEEAMAAWIKAKAAYNKALPAPQAAVQKNYSDALKNLIENMQSLRTDFPEATLHDCVDRDETNDNRVFLGHTALGTFNPTENE
jgi:hypothetical protein